MTLTELRQAVQYTLNELTGDFYQSAYLDWAINRAYQHVVNEIDLLPIPSFLWPSADGAGYHDIAVTPGQREYRILFAVRRIVDVVRLVNGREEPIQERPYTMRNSAPGAWAGDYYVYSTGGDYWALGMISQTPSTQTLRVYFSKPVDPLISDSSEPSYVPVAHHGLIAVKAALFILQGQNRELGQLPGMYAEELVMLRKHYTGAVNNCASKPM